MTTLLEHEALRLIALSLEAGLGLDHPTVNIVVKLLEADRFSELAEQALSRALRLHREDYRQCRIAIAALHESAAALKLAAEQLDALQTLLARKGAAE